MIYILLYYVIIHYICFYKISFEDVGGLDHHIRALKEMVVFPLLYPEVFEKFSISPPRGVLFYGPPGIKSQIFLLILTIILYCDKADKIHDFVILYYDSLLILSKLSLYSSKFL